MLHQATSATGWSRPPQPLGGPGHLSIWVDPPTSATGWTRPPRPLGGPDHPDLWVDPATSASGWTPPPRPLGEPGHPEPRVVHRHLASKVVDPTSESQATHTSQNHIPDTRACGTGVPFSLGNLRLWAGFRVSRPWSLFYAPSVFRVIRPRPNSSERKVVAKLVSRMEPSPSPHGCTSGDAYMGTTSDREDEAAFQQTPMSSTPAMDVSFVLQQMNQRQPFNPRIDQNRILQTMIQNENQQIATLIHRLMPQVPQQQLQEYMTRTVSTIHLELTANYQGEAAIRQYLVNLRADVSTLANVIAAHEEAMRSANGSRDANIVEIDRKSTRLNSSHVRTSRMPSSA